MLPRSLEENDPSPGYPILEDFQEMAAAAAGLFARVCLQPDRN
jgi:hypothetical protein